MPRESIDDNFRFTMKIPPAAKARLLRAAALEHITLTEFLLHHSLRAAELVIERAERITLSERDTWKILDLLDHPREANSNLVEVLKSRPRE